MVRSLAYRTFQPRRAPGRRHRRARGGGDGSCRGGGRGRQAAGLADGEHDDGRYDRKSVAAAPADGPR